MIEEFGGGHFAEFFLNSFLDGALFSLGSAFEVGADVLDFFSIGVDFVALVFESEDEEHVFVESDFLWYDGSSFEDGFFKFFIGLEMFECVGIE
jgi:hypothetical protein